MGERMTERWMDERGAGRPRQIDVREYGKAWIVGG